MSNLPQIKKGHKICIICEGFEDDAYINRLLELNVWNNAFEIKHINAKSASNIFARYQNIYNNDSYEIVLIFCDTDKAPYKEYAEIKKKINNFHDKKLVSDKIIIFANPCTMQIVLSHFGEVNLKNQGKKTNGDIIFNLTGIKDYDAHQEQITSICKLIKRANYFSMKERIATINVSDTTSGSTNFSVFINHFEGNDDKWIKDINHYLRFKK